MNKLKLESNLMYVTEVVRLSLYTVIVTYMKGWREILNI